MHDALGQGEGVMAAEAAREPLTIDAENRLAFIEPGSSYIVYAHTWIENRARTPTASMIDRGRLL